MKYLLIAALFLFACTNKKQKIVDQIQDLKEEIMRDDIKRDKIGIEMNKETCAMVQAIRAKKTYDETKMNSLDTELLHLNLAINKKQYQIDSLELALKAY